MFLRHLYKFLLVFQILCLLASCTNESFISFHKIDRIQLPLPKNAGPHPILNKYKWVDPVEHLYWYNKYENEILCFDLEEKSLTKTLVFEKDGPQRIGKIRGFSVLDDCILLNTLKTGKLVKVDLNGNYMGIVKFSDTARTRDLNNYTLLNSKMNSDVIKFEDGYIVPLRYPNFQKKISDVEMRAIPIFRFLNQRFKVAENVDLQIGKIPYEGIDPLPNTMSSVKFNSQLTYSFHYDETIYFASDLKNRESKDFPSAYLDLILPANAFDTPFERFANTSLYLSLYAHDSYPYLFRTIKLSNHDIIDFENEYHFPGKFSIQIIDKSKKLLAEKKFEYKHYSIYNTFLGKRGLYFQLAPSHPDYDENKLTFDVYSVEQNDNR